MKKALENSVPTELFEAYETVMDTITRSNDDSKELAQKILSWLFYALRPLQMSELREAIAVREGDRVLDDDDLLPTDDIVEVCRSLVSYDPGSGIVGFSHEMVQDFLRQRYCEWLLPESEIAKICIAYLSFDFLSLGLCGDEKSLKERLEKNPLVDYAARKWGIHLEKGNLQDDLQIQECLIDIWKSPNRADAIAQILVAENESDWKLPEVCQSETGLHALARYNLVTLAKRIIDSDAELVDAVTVGGDSPLMIAAAYGRMNMVNLFLNSTEKVHKANNNGYTPLHVAVSNRHSNVVLALLQADADVNSQNKFGSTPLHLAVSNGHAEIVRTLLDAGSSVMLKNEAGKTALHLAEHLEILRQLIAVAGVDLNTSMEWTALHFAARQGRLDLVNCLLEAGADAAAKTVEGFTPLRLAAYNGYLDIVQRLLEVNPAMSADTWGENALHDAAARGHLAVVKLLLASGADTESRDNEKCTPLHYASQDGHLEVVDALLDAGADPNGESTTNITSLHLASSNGGLNVVERLISLSLNVNCQSNTGQTPLHHASEGGHIKVVERLIAANADLHIQSRWGDTPLHRASWNGHLSVVSGLLNAGANHSLHNHYGHTPFTVALIKDHTEVALLLLKSRIITNQPSDDSAEPLSLPTVEDLQDGEVSRLQLATYMAQAFPKDPSIYNALGCCLFAEGQFDQAIGVYETALKLDSQNDAALGINEICHAFHCDNCNALPIHGYRHQCKGSYYYDLCHQCFNTKPHPHPQHEFLTIPRDQWICECFKIEPGHPETGRSH